MSASGTVEAWVAGAHEIQLALATRALMSEKAPVSHVMYGNVDIRKLSHEQCTGLVEGPSVILLRNGIPIAQVPKRASMATSTWANEKIREDSVAQDLTLPGPASSVNVQALKKVAGWVSSIGRAKVTRIPKGEDTIETCKIIHAASVLGLSLYALHLVAEVHTLINDQGKMLTYPELSAILNAVRPEDSLFMHLALDLAHRRYIKAVPDPKEFSKYLYRHSQLRRAMGAIDHEHSARRKAANDKRKADKAVGYARTQKQRFEERTLTETEHAQVKEEHDDEPNIFIRLQRARRAGGSSIAS